MEAEYLLQKDQVYAYGFKGEDKIVTIKQGIVSWVAKDKLDASKWRKLGF